MILDPLSLGALAALTFFVVAVLGTVKLDQILDGRRDRRRHQAHPMKETHR